MKFLHGFELTTAIRGVSSSGAADIAVAFWGDNACSRLSFPEDMTRYRIICDAYSGACSPDSLKEMLIRGAKIVNVPHVHSKVYRSQTAMVVTSANASSNGLSEDELSTAGLEAGIYEKSEASLDTAKNWFEDLFRARALVSLEDIKRIRPLWSAARNRRQLRLSLAHAINMRDDGLKDRGMRVYIYRPEDPPAGVVEAYKQTPYFNEEAWETMAEFPLFWDEMPGGVTKGDELLCFEVSQKTTRCVGVWNIIDKLGSGKKAIWPCTANTLPFGRPLGDTRTMAKRVNELVETGVFDLGAAPLALDEFANAIAL